MRRAAALLLAACILFGCGGTSRSPQPLDPATKTAALSRCGMFPDNRLQLRCYQDHFDRVQRTEGIVAALDEIVSWHRNPAAGPFAQHCHEVLHDLGIDRMAAAETETDRIAVFADARVTCTGGFVHGALTQYYEQYTPGDVEQRRATLCVDLIGAISAAAGRDTDATGWLSWNCNHMLGHVLYEDNTDDLVRGAALCASFEPDSDERRGCEAGFFMEHFLVMGRTPTETGYAARPTTMADVHKLCRDVDQSVARGCWNESGGVVYAVAGYDWAAAGRACATAADTDDHALSCYESLGRNIAPYAGYEPEQMQTWCREIGDQLAVETCARVIAGSQAMELADVAAGELICTTMIRDAERQRTCIDGVRDTGEQLDGSGFGGGIGSSDGTAGVWDQ